MFLGADISGLCGFSNCRQIADSLGITAIQLMFSDPIRWSTKDISDDDINELAKSLKGSKVEKVLFHGIYLINLARGDSQKFNLSKLSVETHLRAVEKLSELVKDNQNLEILGLTFHIGSAIDLQGNDAINRVVEGLDSVFKKVENGMLLLETSAGAGNIMGDTFEELAEIREKSKYKERIGYVIDTQHTFVSGYDWVNDLEGVVNQIKSILGLENVKAIHLNDSATPFDSHKDRHSNIGLGEFGVDGIIRLLRHKDLKKIPFILETPAVHSFDGSLEEISKMKKFADV